MDLRWVCCACVSAVAGDGGAVCRRPRGRVVAVRRVYAGARCGENRVVGFGDHSQDTIELVRTSGAGGAVPIVSFSSQEVSYYDHFDWPYEVDWYQPR